MDNVIKLNQESLRCYRICYDKLFLPNLLSDGFMYKGERIFDVSVYFEYQIMCRILDFKQEDFPNMRLDRETQELFFVSNDETVSDRDALFGGYYMNRFYTCRYNKDSKMGYDMIRNMDIRVFGFDVFCRPAECFKLVHKQNASPVGISHDELCDILRANPEVFDYGVNKPAQSVSYMIHLI